MYNCNRIIDEFLDANYAEVGGERHRYAMRQLLDALVRQAKSEQLAEIRRNAERAMRMQLHCARSAQIRQLRREAGEVRARISQQELEFGSQAGIARRC